MEIQGKVLSIGSQQTIGNKQLQVVRLTTNESYPQTLEIEFWNKAIHEISGVQEGQTIDVHINIRGKESNNGKIYHKIVGWKINKHPKEVDTMSQMPLRG